MDRKIDHFVAYGRKTEVVTKRDSLIQRQELELKYQLGVAAYVLLVAGGRQKSPGRGRLEESLAMEGMGVPLQPCTGTIPSEKLDRL